MDLANRLEVLYHEIILRSCKGEEAIQWENARHKIMMGAITESMNYYGRQFLGQYEKFEEREM
jgi:hypothetical protein